MRACCKVGCSTHFRNRVSMSSTKNRCFRQHSENLQFFRQYADVGLLFKIDGNNLKTKWPQRHLPKVFKSRSSMKQFSPALEWYKGVATAFK